MRTVFTLMLLLMVTSAFAAEQDKSKEPATATVSGEIKLSEPPEKKSADRKQEPVWPRPHQPSEEISADSIVAFPVDI